MPGGEVHALHPLSHGVGGVDESRPRGLTARVIRRTIWCDEGPPKAVSSAFPHAPSPPQLLAAMRARAATVTYGIGERALTPAAMRLIIKRTALAAADQGLVDLMGADLDHAIDALSTHSLRVGLTQDLFANGEDAGPIAQALRWTSTATALRYGRKLAPSSNAAVRMLKGVRK